ncbi:uncharacterized protein JCM15063_002912 [Sporobolomyces koalae]|uniref:uncharacterized protein n=1 Tax=Sporobolomyces koalae TaxID=500713 RepID=UPI0031826C18
MDPVKVKLKHGSLRSKGRIDPSTTYSGLLQMMYDVFGVTESMALMYKDEYGEWVPISSELETTLQEHVSESRKLSFKIVPINEDDLADQAPASQVVGEAAASGPAQVDDGSVVSTKEEARRRRKEEKKLRKSLQRNARKKRNKEKEDAQNLIAARKRQARDDDLLPGVILSVPFKPQAKPNERRRIRNKTERKKLIKAGACECTSDSE